MTQGIEIMRGCRGLNIVGGDLVEVSPPYDTSGNTALVAANLLYELLGILGAHLFDIKFTLVNFHLLYLVGIVEVKNLCRVHYFL